MNDDAGVNAAEIVGMSIFVWASPKAATEGVLVKKRKFLSRMRARATSVFAYFRGNKKVADNIVLSATRLIPTSLLIV
jgi:hypothetical protein